MTVGRSHFELRNYKQKRRKHRATNTIQEVEHLPYTEKLRVLGLCSLERKKVRGDLTCVYKYLVGSDEEEAPRLFSVMPMGQTRGNGHKSKNKKYKNIFTVQVIKHWNKLSRDVVVFICGSKPNWTWVWTTCSS